MAVVAAPEVEAAHGLGHDAFAFWIFTLPLLLGAVVEAPVLVLSDRRGRPRVLVAALLALGLAFAGSAVATRPWTLSLALALAGAASGVACATAQAELVVRDRGGADGAMGRWTAFAAAGDVAVPLIAAGASTAGLGHRAVLGIAAGCGVLLALRFASRRISRRRPARRRPA